MERSEKLIATIKEKNIRPAPKWRFFLKNGLASIAFILAVLMGALAFSIVLFAIQQTDFNVLSHLSHSRLEFFLGLLPLFWIALLTVALAVAMFGIRHSRKGYKFSLTRRVGYSAALSILLGAAFFISGGAHQLEHAFAVNVSLYESIQEKKIRLWMRPDDGQLAGKIDKMNDTTFQLTDFDGQSWTIRFADAFVAPIVLLEPGEQVKLMGIRLGKALFRADEIRPWQGPGGPGGQGPRWRRSGE